MTYDQVEDIRHGVESFDYEERQEWLARAQGCIQADLEKRLQRYIRTRCDARALTLIRREAEEIMRRYLPESVKRFVLVDGDPIRFAEEGGLRVNLWVPEFKHDCDACTFLGRVSDDKNQSFDLYVCDKAGYRTYIARFGDEGPEYISGYLRGVSALLDEAMYREANS